MRLNISKDKPYMIEFLLDYLNKTLVNKEVEAIINGVKYEGFIGEIFTLEEKPPYQVLVFTVNGIQEKVPLLIDKTKIRVGKSLYVLETETHSTVIEIIE
jgi:hypothetical protein